MEGGMVHFLGFLFYNMDGARVYAMNGWDAIGLLLYRSDGYGTRVSHLYSNMEEEGCNYSPTLCRLARAWCKFLRV